MKYIILLIYCFAFYVPCAQPLKENWQKCYGGTDFDVGCDLIRSDTSLIIFGHSASNDGLVTQNHGNLDFVVFWCDTVGNFKKSKTYGGYEMEEAAKILDSHNGFLYLTGTTFSNDNFPDNHGDGDFVVIKIDTAGNQIWEKCYGGSSKDLLINAVIFQDFIYLCGETMSNDGNITLNQGLYDMWIVKIDFDGNVIWQKTYGGTQEDAIFNIYGQNQMLILSGNTSSFDGDFTCNPVEYEVQAVLMKIDTSGTLMWNKCYGGLGAEVINQVKPTSDSGYFCFGTTLSSDGPFYTNHGGEDFWIMKIDNYGNQLWQKCLGGSGNDRINNVIETSDHNYLMTGSTTSYDGQVIGNHSLSNMYPDGWWVKVNSLGDIIWTQCFGGNLEDGIGTEIEYSPGRFNLLGSTRSGLTGNVSAIQYGNFDSWVLSLTDTSTSTVINEKNFPFVRIYPNPSHDYFCIDYNGSLSALEGFAIYDLSGLMMTDFSNSQGWKKLYWNPDHQGVYILKTNLSNQVVRLIKY